MSFKNYLEPEEDKGYYSLNSLAYYYDKMAEKEKRMKELDKTVEGYRITLTDTILESERKLKDLALENDKKVKELSEVWDKKMEGFDDGVKDMLSDWVNDGTMDHVVDTAIVDRKVTEQMEVVNKRVSLSTGSMNYGQIELPNDFPRKLPFQLKRKKDGKIVHNFNFDTFEKGAGVVYVKAYSGNNSSDGLSEATPVQALGRAIEIANGLPEENVLIKVYDDYYDDTRWNTAYGSVLTVSKNIIIKSVSSTKKTVFHSGQRSDNLTWTHINGNVYSTTRTQAWGVIDCLNRGVFDEPIEYEKKETIEDCEKNFGSWYTDGTIVYVNTIDQRPPDQHILTMLTKGIYPRFNIQNGKRLVLRGCEFLFSSTSSDALRVYDVSATENNETEFWAENCRFGYGKGGNGLGMMGIHSTFIFNSFSHNNKTDGFNYHSRAITPTNQPLVFEYYCTGFKNGDGTNFSSNGTTAHDGMNVIRIGSIGFDCFGGVLADVNGCYSILIDCDMGESTLPDNHSGKASYFFNTVSAVKPGKVLMINCTGGTKKTPFIKTDNKIPLIGKRLNGYIPDEVVKEFTIG